MNTNRMGLGLRPPSAPAYGPPGLGQGPPLSALSANGIPFAPPQQAPPLPQSTGPKLTAFVGSISPGITDGFLTQLLSACGPLRSFKRTPTASGKPGAFGFAEFDEPDAISRALKLLDGLMLPALEKGSGPAKPLKLTADAKTKALLETYDSQKMETDADSDATVESRKRVENLMTALRNGEGLSAEDGSNNPDYSVPAHLKDLQEADLPENQRGIVLSEIAQFRERAMKKEKDKVDRERTAAGGMARGFGGNQPPSGPAGYNISPQGPKQWGSQNGYPTAPQGPQRGWGSGPQGYANKPVGFVRGGDDTASVNNADRDNLAGESDKTDEELETERRRARERKEDISFRDRERRYEPRERQRIAAIERTLARERVVKDSEDRDRTIMKASLDAWDDEESDELFYLDRARWRARRTQVLAAENAQDTASRNLELREAEHLRLESERFLARQMDDLRSLAEEQRKAGLLLVGEDSGPLRLNMSMGVTESASGGPAPISAIGPGDTDTSGAKKRVAAPVFGDIDDEEEEGFGRKRRKGLVKLDFGIADGAEANKERLNKLKDGISRDKDVLFKFKVRWEALNDQLIDIKFEKLTKRKMKDYLGELEDDDLIMFVVEHLKDHKGPTKLIEGLEPVLVEEAEDFTVLLWRQIVFESVAYAEGLETGDIVLS
ncbi:hypothetical protein FRB94_002848 [Tulasnella sp. JGI-2019a]|nr:hypothetical protein FRB94_002848 [Tulasnella sp. JGI-2019a]